MMPAIMPNLVIRPVAPLISYGPSSSDFTFLFQFDRETETGMEWKTLDMPAVPEWGIPYAFNCVAASGVIVATGKQFGSVADAIFPTENSISSAMSDLRGVVCAIRDACPLPLAADLDDVLTLAVQAQGPPANIEDWARQLAADISDLTD